MKVLPPDRTTDDTVDQADGEANPSAPAPVGTAQEEIQKRKRLIVSTTLVQSCTLVIGLVSSVATSRGLGPTGRGYFANIIGVAVAAHVLGHMSVEQSQTYQWVRGVDRRTLASNAVVLGLLNGMLAASVAWIIVRVVAPGAFPNIEPRNLALGLLAVPMNVVTLYLQQLTRLDDRIHWYNRLRLVSSAAYMVAVLVLWRTHQLTVFRAIVTWLVSVSVPAFFYLRGFGARPRHIRGAVAWKTIRLGLAYHPAMASVFLLWRVDQFLVNDKTSTAKVGLYVTAVTVAEMAQVLTAALSQVMLPKQTQGSLVDATTFTSVVVRVNLLFSCVVAIGLAVASPIAITLVYGSEFRGAIVPLLALLPGVVGASVLGPCQTVLVRLNKPSRVAMIYFSMLALNVVLNLLLIPVLGITGASLSSTIAYLILSCLMINWISRSTKHPLREFVPGMADLRTLIGILPGRRAHQFGQG